MAERRKIIIQTGADPDRPLSTPHFDAEATMTARPVVPLSEQDAFQMRYGGYAPRAPKSFWKRPAGIALIVVAAVGIGVAAGLAIGVYRNRKAPENPIAAAPSVIEDANAGQTIEPQPTPQARVSLPEETVEPPVRPSEDEETSRTTDDEPKERTTRNDRTIEDDEVKPPVVRDKKRDGKRDDDDSEVFEDRQAERERRREERRERRRREREAETIPERIERGGREIRTRIEEIFQGPPL